MSSRKKHLVLQIQKMTDRQAFSVLAILHFLRLRRAAFTRKGFFLFINIFQVGLFSFSLFKHPGDVFLILSLAVRVLVVAAIANIPPMFRARNYSV